MNMLQCMHKTSLFLEGQDFASTRRTLTFAPGSRVQFISIAIIDDVVVEANEQFVCELEAMDETVSILDGTAQVVILDNDGKSPH